MGLGFRVWGFGFRVPLKGSIGFRVRGLEFRGVRVWGLGFGV